MSRYIGLARILAIIGAIVLIAEVVLRFFDISFGPGSFIGAVNSLVTMIIVIVVAVVVLIATGAIGSRTKVSFNGVLIIVLGIIGLVFGSLLGGILVIIAGVLLLI